MRQVLWGECSNALSECLNPTSETSTFILSVVNHLD